MQLFIGLKCFLVDSIWFISKESFHFQIEIVHLFPAYHYSFVFLLSIVFYIIFILHMMYFCHSTPIISHIIPPLYPTSKLPQFSIVMTISSSPPQLYLFLSLLTTDFVTTGVIALSWTWLLIG